MASSKTIIKQIEAWVKKQIKGVIEDVEGQMASKGPGVSSYTYDISEEQISAEIAAAAKADLFAGKAVSLIVTNEDNVVAVTPLTISFDRDDGHLSLRTSTGGKLFEWPAESQDEPTPEEP